MSSIIPGKSIEKCLRKILKKEGYELNTSRKYGETGADIIAKKGTEKLYIEVIGFKSSAPARSRDFYQVFFGAVSRLDKGASSCVIALPVRFELGLPARVRQYRTAWKRIAEAFPELEIWLVDPDRRNFQRTKWEDWLIR